jgi:AraC-like DNA-binding protein
MSYREFAPAPALDPFVLVHWVFRVAAGVAPLQHPIPLPGGTFLAIDPDGSAAFVGPRLKPLASAIRGGEIYCGTMFWPGGWKALFARTEGLFEQVVPVVQSLGTVWAERCSGAAVAFRESDEAGRRALDGAFDAALSAALPPDPTVRLAAETIVREDGKTHLADLARRLGLSPRQLRRRFRSAAELSPKEFARLRRVRASAASAVLAANPWADVAVTGGFADQAHLAREFRQLVGVTPSDFSRHARRIDHDLLPPGAGSKPTNRPQ